MFTYVDSNRADAGEKHKYCLSLSRERVSVPLLKGEYCIWSPRSRLAERAHTLSHEKGYKLKETFQGSVCFTLSNSYKKQVHS